MSIVDSSKRSRRRQTLNNSELQEILEESRKNIHTVEEVLNTENTNVNNPNTNIKTPTSIKAIIPLPSSYFNNQTEVNRNISNNRNNTSSSSSPPSSSSSSSSYGGYHTISESNKDNSNDRNTNALVNIRDMSKDTNDTDENRVRDICKVIYILICSIVHYSYRSCIIFCSDSWLVVL